MRVRITDSAGTPVPDANVQLLSATTTLAGGATDEFGRRNFTVDRLDADYEIVIRKIGFERAGRFFRPPWNDTLVAHLTLQALVTALPTVTVRETETVRRKSYHVDADEIASSKEMLLDGLDVVRKLRPDMLFGRVGPGGGGFDPCTVRELWVNGERIVLPPPPPATKGLPAGGDVATARRPAAPRGNPPRRPGMAPSSAGNARPAPTDPLVGVPLTVWTALSTIKPEHIAELNYADCADMSVNRASGRNALYVVLKTGVEFKPGLGSMVIADAGERAIASGDSTPSYRARLLGVYDDKTGEPLEGVEVIDVASGTKAMTTTTGTVSLAYLPDGGGTVRLRKAGYREITIDVVIAPSAMAPITATLVPNANP